MKIQTIQKIIKIGSSAGVTIPAKDLRALGVSHGDSLKVTFEPAETVSREQVELVELTQKLIKRHKEALKHLAER